MRFHLRLLFLLLPAAFPATAGPVAAPESGPCSLADATPATVAILDEDFEILLDDGRRVYLSGLEFPDPPELRRAAAARIAQVRTGKDVFVRPLVAAPDRWRRIPALVFVADGEGPLVSLGALLLSEGHARFRPDPPAESCAEAYLGAEAAGRAAGLSLWTYPDYAIVKISPEVNPDFEVLSHRKGMVLVEGAVFSVGEAGGVVYLNFGQKRSRDFAVVISKRNLVMFEKKGVVPRALAGRRVRVRGLIDTYSGPRMDIASPAQLERVDNPPVR